MDVYLPEDAYHLRRLKKNYYRNITDEACLPTAVTLDNKICHSVCNVSLCLQSKNMHPLGDVVCVWHTAVP